MSVLVGKFYVCGVLLLVEIGGDKHNRFRKNDLSHVRDGGKKMEGFIIGGKNASIDDYPHSVFLMMPITQAYCGASVLNQRILLTAAHCVGRVHKFKGVKNSRIPVVNALAGHENVLQARHKILVIGTKPHDDWSSDEPLIFDIALVFLHSALPLGTHIKRVIVSDTFPPVTKAELTGWGRISDNPKQRTVVLQRARQKLLDWSSCKKYTSYKRECFCAGDAEASSYAARGDSGSGLVTLGHQIIGVVSYREPRVPSITVYTNVSYYYRWIVRTSYSLCKMEKNFNASLKYIPIHESEE